MDQGFLASWKLHKESECHNESSFLLCLIPSSSFRIAIDFFLSLFTANQNKQLPFPSRFSFYRAERTGYDSGLLLDSTYKLFPVA